MIIANRASTILYRFLRLNTRGCFILPVNVCPVVPLTFLKAGVKFEFFDISPTDYCLDTEAVLEAVKTNPGFYSGVLFVNTYGALVDNQAFFSELKSEDVNISVIADRCLCYPDFGPLGSDIDLEIYSTGKKKAVDLGVGGYAKIASHIQLDSVTEVYEPEAEAMIEIKIKEAVEHRSLIQPTEGNWLDTGIPAFSWEEYKSSIKQSLQIHLDHRKNINNIYNEYLPADAALDDNYQNWRFNILTDKKETILKTLFDNGLFASSHYLPTSVIFGAPKTFPNATNLFNSVINLFNDHNISESQAKQVCDLITEIL